MIYALGMALDRLDFTSLRWTSHGADPNANLQYIDQEFMTVKEYDAFLFDPTDYYPKTYLPRVASAFAAIRLLPDVSVVAESVHRYVH